MDPTRQPRIKVCCISSIAEAQLAVRYGAAALGLVAKMPSGPGVISEPIIAEIAATIPPAIGSFLLTSEQNVQSIIDQQRRCRVNTLQIVDRLEVGGYDDLREALPGVSLVQVVHVTGEESFDEACQIAEQGVDALLLDSGDQRLAVKQLGGTGRPHDWSISRRIREAVDVPVFLAGGLRAENVKEAIQAVQPFGIDLCSGVRTDGRLDESKLARFVEASKGPRPMNQSEYLVKQLADELAAPESGKQSVVLNENAKTKVVLFSFAAGGGLAEHVAPCNATVQIISGTAAITVGDVSVRGKPGTWIQMAAKTPHSIQAESNVVMLLTLVK